MGREARAAVGIAGTPQLVGQLFRLLEIAHIRLDAAVQCNCGGPAADTVVAVINGGPVPCAACGRVYSVGFDVTTGQVKVGLQLPETGQPS